MTAAIQTPVFDAGLITRYDRPGPRYTSYPTADRFHYDFGENNYFNAARHSNEFLIPRPLSLYLHIPFCRDVCYYCACNKIITRDTDKVNAYVDTLIEEIALHGALYDNDRRVDQLHFGGGTPTYLNEQQFSRLFEALHRAFHLDDPATTRSAATEPQGDYSIEIDPRTVDASKLQHLRELGLNRISVGVQDFDDRVQRAVHRVQSLEQTRDVMDAARQLGFRSLNIDLMYGLPLQTSDSFARTLDSVIALEPDRLSVFNYAHLPKRFGPQRRIDSADIPLPEEKLALLQLTVETLTTAGYVYIGMDHFALPGDELSRALQQGTLQRNFQGYSTHAECDMVAMGVSAISNVCECFSQAPKDIDDWTSQVRSGHIPVERGTCLTPDDRIRSTIINELTCRGATDLAEPGRQYRFDARDYFARELQDLAAMQQDGLVSIDGLAITVRPAGQLLLRNICMVFDRYLNESENSTQFSRTV